MKETNGNGSVLSIAQAIEEMKMEQGDGFSLERINLAELERRKDAQKEWIQGNTEVRNWSQADQAQPLRRAR